jgi:predicted RND superfamily exporter protein
MTPEGLPDSAVPQSVWRRAVARATGAAIDRPWAVLGLSALAVAISIRLASGLEIRSDLAELLPSDVPSVAQIKAMSKRVGGDASVLVVLENKGPEGLLASKKAAPALVKDLLALGPDQVRSVQWNMLAVKGWFADHWPLFAPEEDLRAALDALKEETRKRATAANPLAVSLDDDDEPAPDGRPAAPTASDPATSKWLDPKAEMPRDRVEREFAHFEDGFLVHPERKALILNVRLAATGLGVKEARAYLDRMAAVLDKHRPGLAAAGVRIGFGGSTPMFIAEYEAITGDVFGTAVLCFSVVLVSILLFYRELRSTAALAISTLSAVAVTFGLTWLAIGYLNTQTAFLGVIVAGNGVNYGIIYLARVQQLRRAGVALREACVDGATTCAQATLLASAATSVSFAVLVVAANRGFRHFGFIGGMGMLLCWLATFAMIPAILAVWERVRPFRLRRISAEEQARMPRWVEGLFGRPAIVVGLFALAGVASAALFMSALPNALERNLDNLSNDPLGGQVRHDNDLGQSCLGRSIAGTLALLDSRDEADEFCDRILERKASPTRAAGALENKELVQGCETISAVLPRRQAEKLDLVRQLREALPDSLLSRLTKEQAARLRSVRDDLGAQRILTVADAPPELTDPFRERDGQIGRLAVVTAAGNAHIERGPNLKAFVNIVRRVPVHGRLVDGTGSNVIFSDLLDNIETEGPRTTLFSFVCVCLLVLLFFRNWKTAAEVLGTLFMGVLLMAGVAAALHVKINFFNFVVYPITFGIAVDYGANVAARNRERGGRALRALVEVGPAVALCSWTSVIGYGSLLLSINRALRSFGEYGMLGEVMSILAALVLLPALLFSRQRSAAPRTQPNGSPLLRDGS